MGWQLGALLALYRLRTEVKTDTSMVPAALSGRPPGRPVSDVPTRIRRMWAGGDGRTFAERARESGVAAARTAGVHPSSSATHPAGRMPLLLIRLAPDLRCRSRARQVRVLPVS